MTGQGSPIPGEEGPTIADRLRSVVALLEGAARITSTLTIAAMALILAVQVVLRYVFGSSISWSEEAPRYLLSWCVFIGLVSATGREQHLSLDLVPATRLLDVANRLMTIGFLAFMSYYGVQLLGVVRHQRSPVMGVSLAWQYGPVAVGTGLAGLVLALRWVLRRPS